MAGVKKIYRRIQADIPWLGMPLIIEAGADLTHKSSRLNPHIHSGFEIVYVHRGEIHYHIESHRDLHFRGGEILLMQPETRHWGEFNILQPSTIYWIMFNPIGLDADQNSPFSKEMLLTLKKSLEKAGNTVSRAGNLLPVLFAQFYQCLVMHQNKNETYLLKPTAQTLIAQILIETVNRIESQKQKPMASSIQRVIEQMEKKVEDKFHINDLAATAGLSISRFHQVFRDQTGQTPAYFLQRLRCQKAREQLEKGTDSITDIAFNMGFSSSQYFANCLRKYFGVTPSSIRRKLNGYKRL